MNQTTSEQRNALKQEAFPLLPQDLESPEGQKTLQEMLCTLIPPVDICRKKAEQELWPKVSDGSMDIKQAIAQCAYDADRILGITRTEGLQLEQKDRQTLLQGWIVLEYYRFVLKEEYSAHIRQLQEQLGSLLIAQSPAPREQTILEEIPGLPPIAISPRKEAGIPAPSEAKTIAQSQKEAPPKKRPIGLILGAAAVVVLLVALVFIQLLSPVTKTEKAIDAIGTVTLEARESIAAAQDLYESLTEKQQGKVENADVLKQAKTEYEQMRKALDTAVEAINGIGTVTIDSGDQIKAARSAYDALKLLGLTGHASKELLILEQAEKEFEGLYIQTLFASAQELQADGNPGEALEQYRAILAEYPNAAEAADCKTGAMDCAAALAQTELKAGNAEAAWKLLADAEELCEPTEGFAKAKTALEQKLKQLRPFNGKTFKNTADWGWNEFTVTADSSSDAFVKLESLDDPGKYVTFYVQAGQSATVKVKDGSYIAKYTTGEHWFGPDAMFGENAAFTKADDTFTFSTSISGSYVNYTTISITLYSVVGGDLSTSPIPADSF